MKRYLGRRLIGIVLAGMLIVENCITTQAAEFPEAETEIQSETYEETQDMQILGSYFCEGDFID